MNAPAAAVGDPGELLDVDVHELAGPVSLVSADRFAIGRAVSGLEPGHPFRAQDVLHGRRGQAGLMGNVIGAPPVLRSEPDHRSTSPRRRFVW
jgi:hypothetical protein